MEKSWIHHVRGKTTRQARVGTVGMHEELFGRQGFFGPTAMLYHAAFPNAVIRVEGALRPVAGDVRSIETADHDDPRGEATVLLSNCDVTVAISRRRQAMPYCYRSADGDLLYFVHTGRGLIATEFGPLEYEPGDYIYLPKGTVFRLMPADEDGLFLVTESVQPIKLSEHQQIGRHAPFDPGLLTIPEPVPYQWADQTEWELRIKSQGGYTSVFYANNPMDLIGWKGDLFPFKLNIRDIIPISSDRIHLPPSSWATFETDSLIVVTFLPQVAVADMTAEELPSNHRNIDCDEILLVHGGTSHPVGTLLHMPQGVMHGSTQAQRDAFNKIRTPDMRRTLTAVSIDTYRPAKPSAAFQALTAP